MKFNITQASDMVGVTRATLYRHIDKKGITVEKDEEGNPVIDASELVRVYGDKVKVPSSEEGGDDTIHSDNTPSVKQSNTPTKTLKVSNNNAAILEERIAGLEREKATLIEERERERRQLQEQLDRLQEDVSEHQAQQKRLTLLLTDQSKGEEKTDSSDEIIKKLQRQNARIWKELQAQKKKNLWQRLFG